MEFCGGGDLAHYIYKVASEGGTIAPSRVWSMVDQISLALHRCHTGENHPQDPAGPYARPLGAECIRVYHRDLKPANSKLFLSFAFGLLFSNVYAREVFLDSRGNIKLGDFGLCAIMDPGQRIRWSMVGTPQYMAPEVASGESYSEKSESWGLGCIAHELATLRPTFYDGGEGANAFDKWTGRRIHPTIPAIFGPIFQDLIGRCFSRDANARPGMKEILDNPYVVEARGQRQLISARTQWEEDARTRETLCRRWEEDLQRRERDLAAQLAAANAAAKASQEREKAMRAKDLALTGRELFIRQQANAILEDRGRWQQERIAMEDRAAEMEEEEKKIREAKAKIEKGYQTRLAELQAMERKIKREQAQREAAWHTKTANLKAEQDAEAERHVVGRLRRRARAARGMRSRTKVRGQGGENSVSPASGGGGKKDAGDGGKNGGGHGGGGEGSDKQKKAPKLWQAATTTGLGAGPMDLGGTFYIQNGLVPYSGDGEESGSDRGGNSEEDEDEVNKMDVGQSFYIRNPPTK